MGTRSGTTFRAGHTSGGTKGITPLLKDLEACIKDVKTNDGPPITHLVLGTYGWGKTTTEKLLSLVPNLEVLDLKNAKKVSHQFGLRDWSMPRAPQLRAFSYGWAYDVSTAHILNIVRGRTKLESLSFDHLEGMMHDPSSGQTDELLVELGASCPNLTRLEITGHLEFTDVGVRALLGGCTKLKTLKLDTRTIFHQQASRVVLGASSLGALTASIATHGLQVAITGYAYDTTSRTFGEGNVNKRAIDVD